MTENYVSSIREVLKKAFVTEASARNADPELILELKVRPPKHESFGDLCCNAVLLLAQNDTSIWVEYAGPFLSAIEDLEYVEKVSLADNGYLNITICREYWFARTASLLQDFELFTKKGYENSEDALSVQAPATVDGLVNARQVWNTEALTQLAETAGWKVDVLRDETADLEGFPTQTALAKCGATKTSLALLSNGPDFARNFSPVIALDKAYANPVFCLPYAHSQISALLDVVSAVSQEGDLLLPLDDMQAVLDHPIELKIAKLLCDWPETVRMVFEKADILYLFSFLHELSLLFFKLVEQVKPRSTDYLADKSRGAGRQLLLRAIDKLICEGLELVNYDVAEEFI